MFLITQVFYFLLPAYLANMAASLAGKFRFLPKPLDGNKKIGRHFLFGPNKTCGGTLLGFIVGFLTMGLQRLLFSLDSFQNLSLIDYQQTNWFYLGLLAGFGPMAGDITASFIKRRFNLKSGAMAPFLDQWNYISGYLLLISVMVNLTPPIIIISFILTLILHPLANILAYYLKIKSIWW